jgi:hypothetical protein
MRLGGPRGWSGCVRNGCVRTPVASRYTDHAIPAPWKKLKRLSNQLLTAKLTALDRMYILNYLQNKVLKRGRRERWFPLRLQRKPSLNGWLIIPSLSLRWLKWKSDIYEHAIRLLRNFLSTIPDTCSSHIPLPPHNHGRPTCLLYLTWGDNRQNCRSLLISWRLYSRGAQILGARSSERPNFVLPDDGPFRPKHVVKQISHTYNKH